MGFLAVWFLIPIKENKLDRLRQDFGEPRKKKSLIKVQAEEKTKHKQDILYFMTEHQKVLNNDIEKLLGVSDATATRYMEELEKNGMIRQIGKTGQGVYYEKI